MILLCKLAVALVAWVFVAVLAAGVFGSFVRAGRGGE